MENTYTYTARGVDNPEQAVTFTLHNSSIFIEIGTPLEHIERTVRAKIDDEEERGLRTKSWLKPLAISLLQRGTKPFSIADVYAKSKDDDLQVKAWLRAAGLRLASITFIWNRVDNPDAAAAFVKEVQRRKKDAEHPGKFRGPLDYWAGWLVAAIGVLMVMLWIGNED